MKCPNCGVEPVPGAAECAGCGIIFAKFKKKIDELDMTPSVPFNPWKGRAIAAAFVVAWLVAFGLYYRGVVAEIRARAPAPKRF